MKFGVNYGGGVKVRVTDKWLMRLDFRQYTSPKPDSVSGDRASGLAEDERNLPGRLLLPVEQAVSLLSLGFLRSGSHTST